MFDLQPHVGHGHIGEYIRVDDEKWIRPQQRQCLVNAAPRLQDVIALVAIRNINAEAFTSSDAVHNLFAVPAEIDDHIVDAGCSNTLEMPLQDTFAANLDQSFRHLVG